MLSAKEIVDYVQGPKWLPSKQQFSLAEARQIGEALGIRWDQFGVKQFMNGLNVELEHGRVNPATDVTHDDPMLTGKIALAHLNEIPDYYDRLAVLENEADGEQSAPRKGGL